ncbi:MAG: spore coat protein [Clostridiaceae bacterium]|nr:spore coat protein [Clostridiaceae bacterium]
MNSNYNSNSSNNNSMSNRSTNSSSGNNSMSNSSSNSSSSSASQNERAVCETLLNQTKGLCDLYMHGAVESSTPQVRSAFDCALKDALTMQQDIYNQMSQKGWYPSQQAPQDQISQTKQKFSSSQQG